MRWNRLRPEGHVYSRSPERDDRIDVQGTGGRNHGRRESGTGKQDRSADKRHRVGRGHAKRLRFDVPRTQERTGETDCRSCLE